MSKNWLIRIGSSTFPAFQVISLVRLVVDRFSLGVTLGLTLVSAYSLWPLSFRIWFTANLLSGGSDPEASKDVIRCICNEMLDLDVKVELEVLDQDLQDLEGGTTQPMLPGPQKDDPLASCKQSRMANYSTQHLLHLRRNFPAFTACTNL